MPQNLTSLLVKVGANIKDFSSKMVNVKKTTDNVSKRFNQFAKAAKVAFAVAFAAAVRSAVLTIKDFEKANSNLQAVLGDKGTEGAMNALSETAKKLGSITAFTASEVSSLQTEFAKLGFSVGEIQNATKATLDLAAAAGTDLANAATITGSTIRAFNLDASEATRVTDVMAKSFSISSLDIEKFSTAMGNVAPVAASAGVSVERTTAMLGTITDAGVDASTAGTALRNIFLELSKSGMSFEDAMNMIATATDKNKVAMELFGKRGAVVATVLADNTSKIDEMTLSLEDASGAANEMAETQLDNLAGSITKLGSAWEGFILSISDSPGILKKAIDGMSTLLGAFQEKVKFGFQLGEARRNWLEEQKQFQAVAFKSFADQDIAGGMALQEVYNKAIKDLEKFQTQYENQVDDWGLFRSKKEEDESLFLIADIDAQQQLINYLDGLMATQKQAEKTAKALADVKTQVEKVSKVNISSLPMSSFAIGGAPIKPPGQLSQPSLDTGEGMGGTDIMGMGLDQIIEKGLVAERILMTMQETANAIGHELAMGAESFKEFGEASKAAGKQFLDVVWAEVSALAIKTATANASSLGPLGMIALPALIGAALGMVKTAFNSITAFAEGGIVTGPTMGLVGEAGPEVIFPLSKLESFMGQGTAQQVQVQGVISGNDIHLSNNRTINNLNRVGA
tara:strand:+ start:3794 stop:5842 length:2049 start_codon:yes stop_codon:yes gene_type:complete